MGIFDTDGVAPETGMPDGRVFTPVEDTADWDDHVDESPTEHYDIRNTPVDMPESGKKKGRTPKLQSDLEMLYGVLGAGIFPFDNQVGVVVLESAPNCASALYELSTKNAALRRTLTSLTNAGAYGAVISAHLPIAVMVATKYVPTIRENYGAAVNNFMTNNQRAA